MRYFTSALTSALLSGYLVSTAWSQARPGLSKLVWAETKRWQPLERIPLF